MKQVNIYYGYIPVHTIDANLHPDEQLKALYFLLLKNEEVLNIYCNSPYIINEITILEGYVSNNVPHPLGIKISNRHFECLKSGDIIEGKYYKSMISDDNLLNNKLAEGNDKFSDLLELSQELKEKE